MLFFGDGWGEVRSEKGVWGEARVRMRGVVFPEAMPRERVGRPFRALCVWWVRPKALPWAALGRAVGAGVTGLDGERARRVVGEARVQSLACPGLLGGLAGALRARREL